jgi:hypothetical protein
MGFNLPVPIERPKDPEISLLLEYGVMIVVVDPLREYLRGEGFKFHSNLV